MDALTHKLTSYLHACLSQTTAAWGLTNTTCAAVFRFVAYLDENPTEAEIVVWSAHHVAESDEVRCASLTASSLVSCKLPPQQQQVVFCLQIGRGTVSLATAFEHSYQESQVSIVTQAGKHIGEVGVFFVYASKEVSR